MKSVDNVGITFINVVLGSGALNNVVNVQFGTYQFDADTEAQKVDPALAVSCRLRMDYMCAKQLHESLGRLVQSIEAEQAALASGLAETPAERPN